MVGSGSTIIAATKKGFDSFGVDVNPYCRLIVGTKLLSPKEEDITVIRQFLRLLPEIYEKPEIEEPPLSEYFPKDNLINLLELRDKICHIKMIKYILNLCFIGLSKFSLLVGFSS